jgi:hypothetical protein
MILGKKKSEIRLALLRDAASHMLQQRKNTLFVPPSSHLPTCSGYLLDKLQRVPGVQKRHSQAGLDVASKIKTLSLLSFTKL